MKGYRFYAEMPTHRGSKSGSSRHPPFTRRYLESLAEEGHCNVVAVPLDGRGNPLWHAGTDQLDAFAAVSDRSNAAVEHVAPSRDYLRTRCVRIGADLARRLHPAMFNYLETP